MMDMPLDPREVLEHLRDLGYSNISPAQLKDFMKDLKKLIRYDVKVIEQQMEEEMKLSTLQVPSPHSHRCVASPAGGSLNDENKRHIRRADQGCRSVDSRRSYVHGYDEQDLADSQEVPCRKKVECNEERPISVYSSTSKENIAPHRTGFIRPWNLPRSQKPGAATNRCDPVTLYHKYQAYWRQNKVPGESPHTNLRWNVRERMLGQDPHPSKPRPVKQSRDVRQDRKCFCECTCDSYVCSTQDLPDADERSCKYYTRTTRFPYDQDFVITADLAQINA